ncbi:hypothetical protein BDN72DRAFT_782551, partial [Pluteus cervinus]
VEVEGAEYEFSGGELAPPAGIFAGNYSRAIHYENQPHKFAISWTLTKNTRPGVGEGGNFFMAEYGVKVVHAPNGLIVWNPNLYHGTSLFDVHHRDEDWLSTGLAFVTSSNLLRAWRATRAKRKGWDGFWRKAEEEELPTYEVPKDSPKVTKSQPQVRTPHPEPTDTMFHAFMGGNSQALPWFGGRPVGDPIYDPERKPENPFVLMVERVEEHLFGIDW